MKTEDFNYALDERFIAQTPLKNRSDSKLLVMNRFTGKIEHTIFSNILTYLKKGDVLVLNDTKVLKARIFGKKEDTGAHIEFLLLKEIEKDVWECLVKPFKRVHVGTEIVFSKENFKATIVKKKEEGLVEVQFSYEGIFLENLEEIGSMPLPPYIHETLKEQDRYQTVYAKNLGSAAAPTAGLHFTKELLESIQKMGVIVTSVTLHVGLGTFRPVEETEIKEHHMHAEYYEMKSETAEILNAAKKENRRIIAVGTTSTRTLETIMNLYHEFRACSGITDIFIYPGYTFQAIDGLITNFHLPKSTLLMLVSAFSKKEYVLNAYEEAKQKEYRFFSFGDAMFFTNE